MVASDSFAEFLREQLAPLGHVTMRRIFGKTGVFCDGLMLGMVTDNMLYFRVDDHNRAAFEEAEAFPPLNYEKKGCLIDLSFWRAPERLFDEPDELVSWARVALAAARRVAAKRPRAGLRGKSKAPAGIRSCPTFRLSAKQPPELFPGYYATLHVTAGQCGVRPGM
jgi:DNA transformation protein